VEFWTSVIISSVASLSLIFVHGNLSVILTPHIHLIIVSAGSYLRVAKWSWK